MREVRSSKLSLLKKAPAPVPGCGSRPEDGPQSRLFSGESKLEAQSSKPGHRINIQVAPHFGAKVDEVALRRLAAEVLSQEEVAEQTELSLIITDDEALRELNRRFRGVDAPTDVLSFGAGTEERFVSAPEDPPYLGDVVISYQRALAQAEELGHAAGRELKLLVVHGILHLLGYDHHEEAAARKMRKREREMINDQGPPDQT